MELLKEIRKFTCFNQKKLIEYEYEVSEDHKNLRILLDTNQENTSKKTNQLLNILVETAYDDLIEILNDNVDYIKNIFESIHENAKNPRITIKTIEDSVVLDFFRNNKLTTLSESSIDDNTGFSQIMNENAKSFLCNDLEKDFINGDYINPRLNSNKIEKLKNNQISWNECWTKISELDSTVYSYKSTLIIPMAIKSKDTDKERFSNHFFGNINHHKDSRTIWGFLCFDYPEKNIFYNLEDKFEDAGYIIADILSLYLMFFYNHISGSKTFNKALELENMPCDDSEEKS